MRMRDGDDISVLRSSRRYRRPVRLQSRAVAAAAPEKKKKEEQQQLGQREAVLAGDRVSRGDAAARGDCSRQQGGGWQQHGPKPVHHLMLNI